VSFFAYALKYSLSLAVISKWFIYTEHVALRTSCYKPFWNDMARHHVRRA